MNTPLALLFIVAFPVLSGVALLAALERVSRDVLLGAVLTLGLLLGVVLGAGLAGLCYASEVAHYRRWWNRMYPNDQR